MTLKEAEDKLRSIHEACNLWNEDYPNQKYPSWLQEALDKAEDTYRRLVNKDRRVDWKDERNQDD
jgi:hypothetical protein